MGGFVWPAERCLKNYTCLAGRHVNGLLFSFDCFQRKNLGMVFFWQLFCVVGVWVVLLMMELEDNDMVGGWTECSAIFEVVGPHWEGNFCTCFECSLWCHSPTRNEGFPNLILGSGGVPKHSWFVTG